MIPSYSVWLRLAPRALTLGLCATLSLAQAHEAPAEQQVKAVLMSQFDKPEARLAVAPVVIEGNAALAGWTQGEMGGRALLKRQQDRWVIAVCGGDDLLQAKWLKDAGLSPEQAQRLSLQAIKAEAALAASDRAKLSLFKGTLKVDPRHHGAGHGPAAGATHAASAAH
ncbi:MAG: hypothetical protein C4K60_02320 [Ideonella sp. MAG2]|nr:MAG: hypothetical protein C4K60_02320 [Ideonella sp. MAG2]